ncbi:DUF1015 domain-containing protein [Candidatus Soleaferrea massiliensis]|uniref:DUF1015 domain-containing protein n=1 Tax=Candidatus Soleaferrea massiliensis TaxID=1470354 RepID=UPI00058B09FA|nr:DUF1015 domain-containing protein [Candidatus Soleaferrea massiliensis]
MKNIAFEAADILLPKQPADMEKWSVVACDQFTSQPEYWQEVKENVGGSRSTYHMILPEAYLLEETDTERMIDGINGNMQRYLADDTFELLADSLIYVERTLPDGKIRHGLMGAVDLEAYNYLPGSQSLIRATEGTVLERIPPRVKIRRHAPLELPHIMLLIDDEEDAVIGSLASKREQFGKVYDFDMMMGGGHIRGYRLDEGAKRAVFQSLEKLADQDAFDQKYGVQDKGVLLFAVGDGNHSLATAKECFEQLKKTMPKEQWENHPARYALVEVVNVHDDALEFEPIHRVVFDVDAEKMMEAMRGYYRVSDERCDGQRIEVVENGKKYSIWIQNPSSNLPVGSLQNFIDAYTKAHGGSCDYIHGEDVVETLCKKPQTIGFLLPGMQKSQLFETVVLDGVLPRKTFSMGHAPDKRYYLECRKITD